MVGAHLQESRPSQGGEGHAGASMPCAPTRPGDSRPSQGGAGHAGASTPCCPTRGGEAQKRGWCVAQKTGIAHDEVRERSHREEQVGDGTSADDLRRWIVAVAYGKPVLVDSGRVPVERFRLKPALGRGYNIRFTQKFHDRHPQLEKLTLEIAECEGSKWRVWPRGLPGLPRRNAVEIDSSASFVHLLRSMMG